ncbi:MAG: hypothetical protein JNJ51_07910 [Methylobacillus glycogenes]|nr:hypothetical protein [Methylobacillus glycogenes]
MAQDPGNSPDKTSEQMSQELASSIPKNLQQAFAQVVQAGAKFMFSEETHNYLLEQLEQEGDLAENIGQGIAGLILMLYQQSNESLPPPVMVPAGTYLLFLGTEFLEKVTGEKIDPQIQAKAMEVMTVTLMEKLGGVPRDRFESTMAEAANGAFGS